MAEAHRLGRFRAPLAPALYPEGPESPESCCSFPSHGRGLRGPSEVAMKSMMLPVLALWGGSCPGGALTKQGPSLREPTATPTPVGTLTLQPSPPSWPGPPSASCLLTQAAIACSNVKMKHIPALTDPGLPTLYLAENEIARPPAHTFQGQPNLQWLDLSKNKLNWTGLKRLNLDGNSLSTVPALPASLQELKLNDNLLQGLQRSSFRGACSHSNNRLQDDRLAPRARTDLPKLETLDLSHNRLVHMPSLLPRGLRLHHNRIERVPGYVFVHMKPSLELLRLSHNSPHADGGHGVSFLGLPTSLAELLLDHNQLQAIPRGLLRLRGLQVPNLSHSKIRWGPAPMPIMLSQHAALPARGERGS
nr:extracellular matrix protein 2-like [Mirounga angustirostris]